MKKISIPDMSLVYDLVIWNYMGDLNEGKKAHAIITCYDSASNKSAIKLLNLEKDLSVMLSRDVPNDPVNILKSLVKVKQKKTVGNTVEEKICYQEILVMCQRDNFENSSITLFV